MIVVLEASGARLESRFNLGLLGKRLDDVSETQSVRKKMAGLHQ